MIGLPLVGTGDGNRTRTPLRAQDFKSWASTNSATPARSSRLAQLNCRIKTAKFPALAHPLQEFSVGDAMMIKLRFSLSMVVAVVFIAGFAVGGIAQNRQVLAEATRISGDRFTIATRTPQGAQIYATNRPSAAMLNAIDRGLNDLFAVARRNGYTRRLSHREYTIYIGRADRNRDAAGNFSPDIAVGAAQYAGSVYDKGGFIYAAGMVIAFNPMSFLIADHGSNVSRVADLVRYEGEHLVLYHNDRRRYAQTADHSQGGGHPILK